MADLDPYEALKKLAELKEQGILTEEEFSAQKARILRTLVPSEPAPVADGGSSQNTPLPPRPLPYAPQTSPPHAQPSDYISWDEFIASAEINEVLKNNAERYQQKFQRIAISTGIGGLPISAPYTAAKIVEARSFSWAGLLLGPFWAAYRGIYLWQLILAATCIVAISESFLPLSWGAAGNIAVYITCALFGNVLLLTALGKHAVAAANNHVPFRQPSPSWARAFVAIGVVVASTVIGDADLRYQLERSISYASSSALLRSTGNAAPISSAQNDPATEFNTAWGLASNSSRFEFLSEAINCSVFYGALATNIYAGLRTKEEALAAAGLPAGLDQATTISRLEERHDVHEKLVTKLYADSGISGAQRNQLHSLSWAMSDGFRGDGLQKMSDRYSVFCVIFNKSPYDRLTQITNGQICALPYHCN